MNLQPCFKVHNLVFVYPKSIKLGQITTLNSAIYTGGNKTRLM